MCVVLLFLISLGLLQYCGEQVIIHGYTVYTQKQLTHFNPT